MDPSKYFENIRIDNPSEALRINKVEAVNKEITYPYHQMVSTISGNCLSINDEGIYVSPCNSNSLEQQWQMKKDEKLCLMD